MPATNTFDYLSIGGAPGTFSWEGTMDDFRMYDHALSAGEVSALGAVSTAPEPRLRLRVPRSAVSRRVRPAGVAQKEEKGGLGK